MRIRSFIFCLSLVFVLGCSSINKYYQPKKDFSLQEGNASLNNYNFNYKGKGSIDYRGELIIFLFRWINQEKVISILIRDPFEINEISITLNKKNVSMDFKKISWGQFQIDIESFRDNLLARKVLREVVFWINKDMNSGLANKSKDNYCQKTIKKSYWQGRIDGCSQRSKKINLQGKDLEINLVFTGQNGEN